MFFTKCITTSEEEGQRFRPRNGEIFFYKTKKLACNNRHLCFRPRNGDTFFTSMMRGSNLEKQSFRPLSGDMFFNL